MRALPFSCTRPDAAHAAEIASLPASAWDSAHAEQSIEQLIQAGTLTHDPAAAYYLCECSRGGIAQTMLLCTCAIADLASGTIEQPAQGSNQPATDTGTAARDEAQAQADAIVARGAHIEPLVLAYPDDPVLTIILSAAQTGQPLFALDGADGARLAAWEVKRRDSVEAIHAMLERMPSLSLVSRPTSVEATVQAARTLRDRAQAAGTYTGREPFNWFLAALVPASTIETAQGVEDSTLPDLPRGLFVHQLHAQR